MADITPGAGAGRTVMDESKAKEKADKMRTQQSKHLVHTVTKEAWGPYFQRAAVLVLFCALPALLFGVLFTNTGYGITIINKLIEFSGLSISLGGSGLVIILLLYFLDFSYWTGIMFHVKNFLLLVGVFLCICGVVISAKDYPTMPLMTYLLLAPGYFGGIKFVLFRHTSSSYFLSSLSPALFITGTVGIFWWAFSTADDDAGAWPGDHCAVSCRFYTDLNCPGVTNVTNSCLCEPTVETRNPNCQLAAFLVYTSLFIASTAVIIFSFVVYFLSLSMAKSSSKMLNKTVRVFGSLISLGILGLWVAAQIAGADMALSNVVMAFSGAFIFALVVVIGASIGWDILTKELADIPLIATMMHSFASDYFKAIGVFLSPVYLGFLVLSSINQFFRLYLTPWAKELSDEDKKLVVTAIAAKEIRAIKKWPWTSVLSKVMFIGIVYFCLNVGVGKLTYIFLSFVNDSLNGTPLGLVSVIFVIIGLTMFLLPPVPGVPVYLVGGVMLTNAAWEPFGGRDSNSAFWTATIFVAGVCFGIKLTAIACQQKLIGERLGTRVGIRKAVGINSITIRAIKRILSRPGISMAKVAILIGGPDWPTSVLTGILGLSLPSMLLGSLPVMFLVTPTVFAGALMLRREDGGIYNSLGSMFLALCALVQALALFAAMYYIEDESAKNYKALAEEEPDREVLVEEEKDARRKVLYKQVTRWEVLGWPLRLNLIVGAFFTAIYCYLFGFMGSRCFETFNITDTIADKLDGNVLNVVKPTYGWTGLVLFLVSFLQYYLFGKWAGRQVDKQAPDTIVEMAADEVADSAEDRRENREASLA